MASSLWIWKASSLELRWPNREEGDHARRLHWRCAAPLAQAAAHEAASLTSSSSCHTGTCHLLMAFTTSVTFELALVTSLTDGLFIFNQLINPYSSPTLSQLSPPHQGHEDWHSDAIVRSRSGTCGDGSLSTPICVSHRSIRGCRRPRLAPQETQHCTCCTAACAAGLGRTSAASLKAP